MKQTIVQNKKRARSLSLQVCPVPVSVNSGAAQALSVLQWVLVSLEDALLDKLLRVGPAL